MQGQKSKGGKTMEDKKLPKNEELEKVSGGITLSDMPQRDERQGWTSSDSGYIAGTSGGGIYAENDPDPVDCSRLIPS